MRPTETEHENYSPPRLARSAKHAQKSKHVTVSERKKKAIAAASAKVQFHLIRRAKKKGSKDPPTLPPTPTRHRHCVLLECQPDLTAVLPAESRAPAKKAMGSRSGTAPPAVNFDAWSQPAESSTYASQFTRAAAAAAAVERVTREVA